MKQNKILGLIIVIWSTIGTACIFPSIGQSEIQDGWKTLNETGYTIQYPNDFDLDRSGQMGMSFILLSKQVSPQDMFRENVNLIIQDLAGQGISLDNYVEISEGQIKTMITEGKLIESKRIKSGKSEFQKVVYTGKQEQFDLKWLQYYWVKNEKAYVLTLTCEENQFNNYLKSGERIMSTFEIK